MGLNPIIFSRISHILFLKKCFILLKGGCGNNCLFVYDKRIIFFKCLLLMINKYLIIVIYEIICLGADKMPVTLELILFILIAISAVGYLIKESQKTKKRTLGISLELLVLFWSIWRISTIIIQISEYNLS